MNPLPPAPLIEVPWWVTLLLIPAAATLWGWWKDAAWPWLTGLWNADAAAKREQVKRAAEDREERFLVAFETAASAARENARTSADIAQTLKTIESARIADNLTLQRVERRLDNIEDRVGSATPVARRPRTRQGE